MLPAAYVTASVGARAYKFGAVAFDLRALAETFAAALILAGVIVAIIGVSSRTPRTARITAWGVFGVALGGNLLGMQVAGTLGLPASVRLVPQIPDVMFIQTTLHDSAVRSSLWKSAAFWLVCVAGAGAVWWRLSHGRGPGFRTGAGVAVGGLALAMVAQLLPQHIRAQDRDLWIALAASVPGGSDVSAPERINDDFNSIARLDDAPAGESVDVSPPQHVVVVIWETGVPAALGWPDDVPESMPTLRELTAQSLVAERHLSTAPQSTKSIFSIVTGLYPQPSARVETRLKPDGAWPAMGGLFAEAGYDTRVMTSFTGRYDRLDEFFAAAGFQSVDDRHSLDLSSIPDLPLGRDEELMDRAGEWLGERRNDKALLVLMPSNSHHPFWRPGDDGSGGPGERYRRAMQWQDETLARLVDHLRANGTWDHTALALCADHGNYHELVPGGETYLGRYHVPMLIRLPGVGARRIRSVTSHVDVLPTLIDAAGIDAAAAQGESLLRGLPDRLVFQSECYATLRVSCTDGQAMLIVSPETFEEQIIPWHSEPDRARLEVMRACVARFFPYQYWRIYDLTAAPD